MADLRVPSINQSSVTNLWGEQDVALYNALPFYFAEEQYRKQKLWNTYSTLVDERAWQQNMGPIMRAIRKEPSPNLRQMALPVPIGQGTPLRDVISTRETYTTATVGSHQFVSPVFDYQQEFFTFFNDHVKFTLDDINNKIMRYKELFYRTVMWYSARYVYICDDTAGDYLVECPTGLPPIGGAAATGTYKSDAWLINMLERVGQKGTFDITNCGRLMGIISDDLRIPPYQGSEVPKDNKDADGIYLLAMGRNAYRQWTYDPYVLQNRPLNLNVVTERLMGSPFGDCYVKFDPLPLRFSLTTSGDTPSVSMPEPETIEMNSSAPNYQETVPNPAYSRTQPSIPTGTNASQFEVAFAGGMIGYRGLRVGPPPGDWRNTYQPDKLRKMIWNGEVRMTDRVLVPLPDGGYDPNQFGHKLQLIAELALGCLPVEYRSVIPIIYKRSKGPFSTQPVPTANQIGVA